MVATGAYGSGGRRHGGGSAGTALVASLPMTDTVPPEATHDTPHVVIVRNPAARHPTPIDELELAASRLRVRGWIVTIVTTHAPGEATTIAADAARLGVSAVFACGGDGTVHEVADGLAGTDTALGVIRAGTANIWAREAGVPRDAERALELALRGRRVRVDLGIAETSEWRVPFLLMCGLGIDAATVQRVGSGSRAKRHLGIAWYAALGAYELARARTARASIRIDGLPIERAFTMAVIGNTRLYGGVARITGAARIDDGLLDVVAFGGDTVRGRLGLTAQAVRGGLHRRTVAGIEYHRGRVIEIATDVALPVQVDGEFVGETGTSSLRLSVAPHALSVLLAPRPNALLGERGG